METRTEIIDGQEVTIKVYTPRPAPNNRKINHGFKQSKTNRQAANVVVKNLRRDQMVERTRLNAAKREQARQKRLADRIESDEKVRRERWDAAAADLKEKLESWDTEPAALI